MTDEQQAQRNAASTPPRADTNALRRQRLAALNLAQDAEDARRQADAARQESVRAAERLARSNEELQRFAYVASHDLKEPLRKVASSLQIIEEEGRTALGEDAQHLVGVAVDGARRMGRMIDDLLAYARSTSGDDVVEAVPAADALTAALANLATAIEDSGARIVTLPLPTVSIDRERLAQVFQNLLANALKFRREEALVVTIGGDESDTAWRLWVQDNGIGIETEACARIFDMFERLHPRRKYDGAGIGLATCQRIVERRGGRIWVESQPGEGATFLFTIPKVQ